MTQVGQREILTQKHVVQFFKTELGYDYLGHWQDRVGNSNVEQDLLRDWLRRQGHSEKIIGRVLYELDKARAVSGSKTLPTRQDRHLPRVLRYLTRQRHLPLWLLEPLLANGKLSADQRGNAVFLMVAGKAQRPVGAELRGTGSRVWRGMALGSSKDSGYFWIGASGGREIVLCESAIDAISCCAIYPDLICLSTAGVRANAGPAQRYPVDARAFGLVA